MTYVNGAIGVGQCRSNGMSFWRGGHADFLAKIGIFLPVKELNFNLTQSQ